MSRLKKFKSKHKYVGVILLNKFEVLPVIGETIYPVTSSFQDQPFHMITVKWRGVPVSCDIGSVIFPDGKEAIKQAAHD